MPITNRVLKRVARQVFASSRAIVPPFYNRVASRQEIEALFADRDALSGYAVLMSAPMGTGKTFFVDQIRSQLGLVGRTPPLIAKEVTDRALAREKGRVVFLDEADVKSDWSGLTRGVGLLGQHLATTGQVGLLLGDYTLRNFELLELLPAHRFLRSFEPLDREFLQGVIRQRLQVYLQANPNQDVVEPGLYDLLVPDGLAQVNSFRTILSFLEQLVDTLPPNDDPCQLTAALARGYAQDTFDPIFSTDQQQNFLNRLLDHLTDNHPGGIGLESGLSKEQLFELGQRAGYPDWESFQAEVVEPFGAQGLLLSGGIPTIDQKGRFARWVEPYYPSLPFLLLAEA
jgi:hypothetical protein